MLGLPAEVASRPRRVEPERLAVQEPVVGGERRAAEAALRETEQRYRLAAKATNDAIWDWDLASNCVEWNEAVRVLFGYTEGEIEPTGDWWIGNIHPDDRERVDADIHAVIAGADDHWTSEYRFRRGDGSFAEW